MAVKYEFVSSI